MISEHKYFDSGIFPLRSTIQDMAGNTIGSLVKLTTYGESHGKAIGGVLDGFPSNVEINISEIQEELDRRRPGQSHLTTPRNESDKVEFLSGLFEGKSTGAPLAFQIPNKDVKSKDYDHLKDVYRPSHADYTYEAKYGIRDHRGGGRSSARETACRVVGGALARQFLLPRGIEVAAWVSSIGHIEMESGNHSWSRDDVDKSLVRCPDAITSDKMVQQIEMLREQGDTIGGVVTCVARNVPSGLGEPVFDKLHADLAKAMMGINAVKAFEIGSGVEASKMNGSDHNDLFNPDYSTSTNHSGGVQGGISNGADIVVRVYFKPVATLMLDQTTVNKSGDEVVIEGKGRHDPCVVPRAVPIVEAMMLLTLIDHYLRQQALKG